MDKGARESITNFEKGVGDAAVTYENEVGVVAPKDNLFGDGNGKQGLGAWELKFRYSNLQIADGTAKSNRAETFFFRPNWYMNRFVRYVLDLGFERFKDPARSPRPGDRNFFVVLSRVQVAFCGTTSHSTNSM